MEEEWLFAQLNDLFEKSQDYKQKAFFLGLKELMMEQEKRKGQLQGQLDGELWSPRKWEG